MGNQFLKKLQEVKSKYANPAQASTQAKSLDLLSSGIYTEEERFIFELLQNAVDAYNGTEILRVKILLLDGYLIFMHNGDPFTERDIEGLCDVGYGSKMSDVKKIGYKGIGFKSVFMHSNHVTVQSRNFCFKFEKAKWENYWDPDWEGMDTGRKYSMPWQIIPIETAPPVAIDTNQFNVVTYIQVGKVSSLKEKIQLLLGSSSFLLFLRHAQISIEFFYKNDLLAALEKKTKSDVVELCTNKKVDSRWLVHCNPQVKIDDKVREVIASDGITPIKLQEAKTFDLSFALLLDSQGGIKGLDDSCVYTYLPTSISFGFPFLVNANFITDAGRQHLVKDSEWNKMIIREIPYEFLSWISTISKKKNGYYKALPAINIGTDSLSRVFSDSMEDAIRKVAFIPSRNKDKGLLKASEAIMDKVGISDVIGVSSLIKHINQHYNKAYSEYSIIDVGGISILKEYGVFDLNMEKLKPLFADKAVLNRLTIQKDIELIRFLYSYTTKSEKDGVFMKEVIADVPFILSEEKKLCNPSQLFFPSDFRDDDEIMEDVAVIHHKIYDTLSAEKSLIDWLVNIGVSEMDEYSIIEKHICQSGYVTEDNAISVGRYLFEVWENERFEAEDSYRFSNLRFLTTKGTLKAADELFLGSKYYPIIDLQTYCDEDIFISDDYCTSDSESVRKKWRNFFLDMGICDEFSVRQLKFHEGSEVYDLLKDCVDFALKNEYNHSNFTGQDYPMLSVSYINVKYVPYIGIKSTGIGLARIVWNHILSQPVEFSRTDDYIYGSTGWYHTKSVYLCDKNDQHNYLGMNFLPWVIKYCQTFPASTGEMLEAHQLYRNTDLLKDLFGNYLPYIDVDCEIDGSWIELLKLKTDPPLEDYLLLLTNIAKDSTKADDNRERISKIYLRIVDIFDLTSQKTIEKIKSWAARASSKILSKDGKFYFPSSLRYITIEGFSKNKLAYTGNNDTLGNKDKVIQLLRLMGVVIITNDSVSTEFSGKVACDDIKDCLINKVKVLALLKAGEKPALARFNKEVSQMTQKINETKFYRCGSIQLTYGDEDDKVDRTAFGSDSNFYYVGEIRLAKMDPLLTPLCEYLSIRGKERELLITMFEDISAIRDYLSEKEYDISFIKDVVEVPVSSSGGTFSARLDYVRSDDQQSRDVITGFKGEILIYEKLKEYGYDPICKSISDESDYDKCIEFLGKTYYCKRNNGRYDIEYTSHSGKKVLLEVKTTTLTKWQQTNMPISYNEIKLVEECNSDEESTYLIVRVFDIDNTPDIYIFKGHLL